MDVRTSNVRTIHGLLINKPTSCQTAEERLQMLAFLFYGYRQGNKGRRKAKTDFLLSLLKTQTIAGA